MKILTAGKFGRAVAEHVAASLPVDRLDMETLDLAALPQLVADAELVAVVAWRPYIDIYGALDDIRHEQHLPWTLVEMHGQRLTCGPFIAPGRGPCYSCYYKRYLSQHRAPERELVMTSNYRRDAQLGPAGFCQPMVAIAGSYLLEVAAAAQAPTGRVRCVDVLGGSVLESEVIGVHACKKCGPKRTQPRNLRFTEALVPALEDILP